MYVSRGVKWDPEQQKWAVEMSLGGDRARQPGLFITEREAAEAYDSLVVNIYGGDAATNFVTQYGESSAFV